MGEGMRVLLPALRLRPVPGHYLVCLLPRLIGNDLLALHLPGGDELAGGIVHHAAVEGLRHDVPQGRVVEGLPRRRGLEPAVHLAYDLVVGPHQDDLLEHELYDGDAFRNRLHGLSLSAKIPDSEHLRRSRDDSGVPQADHGLPGLLGRELRLVVVDMGLDGVDQGIREAAGVAAPVLDRHQRHVRLD